MDQTIPNRQDDTPSLPFLRAIELNAIVGWRDLAQLVEFASLRDGNDGIDYQLSDDGTTMPAGYVGAFSGNGELDPEVLLVPELDYLSLLPQFALIQNEDDLKPVATS